MRTVLDTKQENSGCRWPGGLGLHHDIEVHSLHQLPVPEHSKFEWRELGHPKTSTCPRGQLSTTHQMCTANCPGIAEPLPILLYLRSFQSSFRRLPHNNVSFQSTSLKSWGRTDLHVVFQLNFKQFASRNYLVYAWVVTP